MFVHVPVPGISCRNIIIHVLYMYNTMYVLRVHNTDDYISCSQSVLLMMEIVMDEASYYVDHISISMIAKKKKDEEKAV